MRTFSLLLTLLTILTLTIPLYAVTIEEKQNIDSVTMTITFTKDEFDLFILDKADPKEWLRNACQVNKDRQEITIKKDLVDKLTLPTSENVKTEVDKLKVERNNKITEQGSGVIYE